MVTDMRLEELELLNIYEYYHKIGEYYIKNFMRRVKEMIRKLSIIQKKACYDYIEDTWGNDADMRTVLQKLLID